MRFLALRDDIFGGPNMTSESHFSPPPPHHILSDFRLLPPSPLEQTSFVHAPKVDLIQLYVRVRRNAHRGDIWSKFSKSR